MVLGRYNGPSLVELVDSLQPPIRLVAKPLRLVIAEVMKTRTLGASALGGKLECGAIQIGTKVCALQDDLISMNRIAIDMADEVFKWTLFVTNLPLLTSSHGGTLVESVYLYSLLLS